MCRRAPQTPVGGLWAVTPRLTTALGIYNQGGNGRRRNYTSTTLGSQFSYMAQTAHTKKTRLACDSCRRQRRKCDRKTPACLSCERRNDVCLYDPAFDQRSPKQRGYVAALEARVVLLEGILSDAGAKGVVSPSELASTDEGAVRAAIAPPPTASTPPDPSQEPKRALGPELEFVPSDDAAQALTPILHPTLGEVAATTSDELNLGMGGYVPLVSLDVERKLVAQFWDWQRGHLPCVAPVPFLFSYALYAQVVHPGVPSDKSVHATPEPAQFISPLLLDAMLAVAALFYGKAELSNRFYKRAESRLMDETANPRLATVQGVMLMATIEFGHARAPTAWTLNGVTVALCVRFGMHVDATLLVRDGNMSEMLFETRNFVFWTAYQNDRKASLESPGCFTLAITPPLGGPGWVPQPVPFPFIIHKSAFRFYALCLGMHPLLDRRIISTPHHSFFTRVDVAKPVHPDPDASVAGPSIAPAEMSTVHDVGTIWRSPTTLGTGDAVVQAGWEAIRDFARIMDTLFDGIYALDAPKRTPQEDLELVARNNLTIQRFLDNLPTILRSTDAIRTKSAALIHLHLSIHISNILACRPFLSPRPLSEDAMRLDAATNISQPTHSSHIIRRYRTLAFRIAHASALQITSLVRYLPLASACVSIPYFVHTACTILLLAPGDTTAMEGVRMGATCLRNMQEMGHWSNIMKDGWEGVLVLANRWDVDIEQGRKILRLALSVRRGGRSRSGDAPGVGSDSNVGPVDAEPGDTGVVRRFSGSSNGTRPSSMAENGIESPSITRPSAGAVARNETAELGAIHDHRHPDSTQEYEDGHLTWMYADPEYSEGVVPASNYGHAGLLPQGDYGAAISGPQCAAVAQKYGVQEHTVNPYFNASGLVHANESANGPTYTPQQQYHSPTPVRLETRSHGVLYHDFSQTDLGVTPYECETRLSSVARQRIYLQQLQRQQQYRQSSSKLRQRSHYQPCFQHPSQKSQVHAPTYHHHKPTSPASLSDVTYALSHARPQHYSHPPQTHWLQILPPANPNLPFRPDLAACTDLAVFFTDTIQTEQDPAFVRSIEDPYAGMTLDWVSDAECSLPAVGQALVPVRVLWKWVRLLA
ncbi:hypothetical protein BDV93DRAFT_504914 [Ceratobasidium sp. AG-I]|nr:hypothetical protein BDV93DRAFT_504914 [Ceratobasidium sp. AG-I]